MLLGWNLQLIRFIDLADGRSIYYCLVNRVPIMADGTRGRLQEQLWLVIGNPEMHFDILSQTRYLAIKHNGVKVIAKGLEQLFVRILKNEGRYFFDEVDFVPEDSF
jgi:hypothetical protein